MNIDNWVNDRLSSLDGNPAQLLAADALLARVKSRDMAVHATRKRFLIIGSSAFLTCAAMATMITVRHETHETRTTVRVPAAPALLPVPEPVRIAKSIQPPPSLAHVRTIPVAPPLTYKQQGSPSAPIGCEVYTDLECPPCAKFWQETMPQFIAEYVDTGKVKLTIRDFPLPQHKYARLAAQWANAAGLIGKYEMAFHQILATESAWHQTGDLESPLAEIFSGAEMDKLRALVNDSAEPSESVEHDRALGADDHINQTPTIVVVWNGHRQRLAGPLTFKELKAQLDQITQ